MLTEQQIADGWIEHDGGECPVDPDAVVRVMFFDGGEDEIYAGFWNPPFPGADDQWAGDCAPSDRIIAYRKETTNEG